MIIIGSQAAKITNTLPIWRNGHTNDYDIIGTNIEYLQYLVSLKEMYKFVSDFEVPNGYKNIVIHDTGIRIEFNTQNLLSSQIIETLSDNINLGWAKVISPTTQMMLKLCTMDIVHFDKIEQDQNYYLHLGLPITQEHELLLYVLKKEAYERFRIRPDVFLGKTLEYIMNTTFTEEEQVQLELLLQKRQELAVAAVAAERAARKNDLDQIEELLESEELDSLASSINQINLETGIYSAEWEALKNLLIFMRDKYTTEVSVGKLP